VFRAVRCYCGSLGMQRSTEPFSQTLDAMQSHATPQELIYGVLTPGTDLWCA